MWYDESDVLFPLNLSGDAINDLLHGFNFVAGGYGRDEDIREQVFVQSFVLHLQEQHLQVGGENRSHLHLDYLGTESGDAATLKAEFRVAIVKLLCMYVGCMYMAYKHSFKIRISNADLK